MKPKTVLHKLSNETLEVIKVRGKITVCKRDKPVILFGYLEVDKAICLTENLIYDYL